MTLSNKYQKMIDKQLNQYRAISYTNLMVWNIMEFLFTLKNIFKNRSPNIIRIVNIIKSQLKMVKTFEKKMSDKISITYQKKNYSTLHYYQQSGYQKRKIPFNIQAAIAQTLYRLSIRQMKENEQMPSFKHIFQGNNVSKNTKKYQNQSYKYNNEIIKQLSNKKHQVKMFTKKLLSSRYDKQFTNDPFSSITERIYIAADQIKSRQKNSFLKRINQSNTQYNKNMINVLFMANKGKRHYSQVKKKKLIQIVQ